MKHLRKEFFQDDEYLDEFEDFVGTVTWSDRNPFNTEMFFLWSMIRSTKPKLFLESGTFKGYSANFICEALERNGNNAKFMTIGFNFQNCLPFARRRLERYRFARVIEGDSREILNAWAQETRPTAFFIDGPKGRNLPPLFFTILAKFPNTLFISIHDCQKESGSRNRWYLEQFFGWEYPIMYCDSEFEDKFAPLDVPLIGKSKLANWKPYHWNGVRQDSYGIDTGYVLPMMGKVGTPAWRLLSSLRRELRFRLYHRFWNVYVDIRTH